MPTHLNDQAADLSRTYANLKQRLDKETAEDFGNKVLALRQLLKEVLEQLEIWKKDNELDGTRLKVWGQPGADWKLERLKRSDEKMTVEESTELATFFSNVSNAVIEAQRNLNGFSQKYIEDLEKEKSLIPPTYFAIPSIKAEMKLGLTEMTSKGVNVILFKNEQQQQRYFESAVTFELVATPPAPATRPKEIEEEGPSLELPSAPTLEIPMTEEVDLELSESMQPGPGEEIDELVMSVKETRAAMLTAIESLEDEKKKKTKARPAAKKKVSRKKATKKTTARKKS